MEYFRIGGLNSNNEKVYGIVGGEYNFVLDKTTDTAKISFKLDHELKGLDTMKWCVVNHDDSLPVSETIVTPDGFSYEKPLKNADEYVIGNINKNYSNGIYEYKIDLLEPIEVLRGVSCETLQFTNQVEKKVGDIVYVKDRLNHLNVLEKILKVTPANNDDFSTPYNKYTDRSWFKRIKILNSEFLSKVNFDDDTINESNLYEVLMNKFDSGLGRTPVLYFGEEEGTYVLDFIRQDGFDRERLSLSDIENIEHKIENKSMANYADGVVSNITNLVPALDDYSISEYVYACPEVDTLDRDLTKFGKDSTKGIWILKLNHNIKNIKSIEIVENEESYKTGAEAFNESTVKRTIINLPVLEKRQYDSDNTLFDTRDVIWYEEGKNIIHLNDFYYTPPIKRPITSKIYLYSFNSRIYKVNYTPLLNFRYDLAEDYRIQMNQIDSQVSSDGFSKYYDEYKKSLNKWDLILQCNTDNYNNILEIGTRVDDYIITNVSVRNRGFEYTVVYQLNKNHIRKNDKIQAPKNIRKNIAIGLNNTKDRMSMLVNNYYLSQDSLFYPAILNPIDSLDLSLLFSPLLTNDKDINKNPQIALIGFSSVLKTSNGIEKIFEKNLLCDITKNYFNNTLLFNMRYNDNAEAGKEKTYNEKASSKPSNQIPVLYTDYFGEVLRFRLKMLNLSRVLKPYNVNMTINDFSSAEEKQRFNDEVKLNREVYDYSADYPSPRRVPQETIDNPVFKIDKINYLKDMLDIFNYTVGLKINTTDNIIICKQFFIDNILLNFTANASGNHINNIKVYNTELQENDFDKFNNSAYIIDTANIVSSVIDEYGDILITLNKEIIKYGKASIVLFEDDKPVLIINRPNPALTQKDTINLLIG